jgi:hypothetical protein
MKRTLTTVVVFAGCALLLPAQSSQTMRASVRGGGNGDSGKCTIEVDVDGAAEVEIRGDSGRIRTLQGQPSNWRRFECTSVLPRNPGDFRFRGIDGRGNVQLVRDPRSDGGVAVVRIEDPQGGREGYTFDLEWQGASGTYSNNDPRYRNDPNYNGGRYDPNYNGGRYDPNYNNGHRYDPNYRDPYNQNNSRARASGWDVNHMVNVCQTEVRARANREYHLRDPRFVSTNVDDRPGPHDRVIGSFEGYRGERYDFACTVNLNNGQVQNVDLRRR